MSRFGRFARSPLLHFLVLGGALFGLRLSLGEAEPLATAAPSSGAVSAAHRRDARIVLSREEVRSLEESFRKRYGFPPNPAQRAALLDQAVLDEILYREARHLSLDLDDGSVERRLVEKMRWVSDRPGRSQDELVREATELGFEDDVVIRRLLAEKMRLVLQQEPGGTPIRDADLQANLESRRAELERPERVTLTQVFLAGEPEQPEVRARAEETLARLRAAPYDAARASEMSDAFPLGAHLRSRSRLQLQARFGKPFAEAVLGLPEGEWAGPIASPYGLHLVRIERRQPAALPPLEEVRASLTQAVLRERARATLARNLTRLRGLYEVEIEGEGEAPGQASASRGGAARASS